MTTLAFSAPLGASAQRRPSAARVPHVLDANRLGDHLDRLYRAALGMTGSPADADDLGYLLRVLRNTFISKHRAAARRPATMMAPENLERFEANATADPERAFEARQLYAQIAELPEHQRDVLVAVDLLGFSYKEAAESFGVPTGTIMSRLFRARKALVD